MSDCARECVRSHVWGEILGSPRVRSSETPAAPLLAWDDSLVMGATSQRIS